MTQRQLILSDLLVGSKITPIDALNKYGCFRLGARINEIKNEGHYKIKTEINKGEKKYAIYSLEEHTK